MRSLLSAASRHARRAAAAAAFSAALCVGAHAQAAWRAATAAELEAALPSRAAVGKERIETEMRTATGIVNNRGSIIAAVVLITAGYAADGKYSHYLLVQAPIAFSEQTLAPGAYVVGWSRVESGLSVRIFDAASGEQRALVLAKPVTESTRVESFRIRPPAEGSLIQIGRFFLTYKLVP